MCVNCMSNTDAVVAGAAFIGYVLEPPMHRALAKLGVVNEPDPVAHDVTTVAFLRSLDLDPVVVLGSDVVAAAEAWTPPQPALGLAGSAAALVAASRERLRASARPIGSHSMLITQ